VYGHQPTKIMWSDARHAGSSRVLLEQLPNHLFAHTIGLNLIAAIHSAQNWPL
jgi:hypothetical protein